MKRILCLLLAPLLLISLTGCASIREALPINLWGSLQDSGEKSSPTLGPAAQLPEVPMDDTGMAFEFYQPLYLPSRDGQRLVVRQTLMTGQRGQSSVRDAVVALLSAREDETALSLGGSTALQLAASASQVETACDVCTVNLSSAALGLDYEVYYRLGLAVAATLNGMDGIRYVNVLTADQAVGLDVAGFLPTGTLSARTGEDLPALWEQMSARRAPAGSDAASVPLNATVTLYFPLSGADGFMPETRNLSFPGQTPQILAQTLLQALAAGPLYTAGAASLQGLSGCVVREPDVSEMPDGGRLVTFFFRPGTADLLEDAGVGWDSFLGALTCTVTTFVPAVGAIRVYQGNTMVLGLESALYGSLSFENGFMRRRQFAPGLMSTASIYLASDGMLTRVQRAVPANGTVSARTLLELLMAGPSSGESFARVLPSGLDGSDILGFAARDDTLTVHLSARFADRLSASGAGERLAAYAMVDTLCEALGLSRVRFCFDGTVRERLGGEIWWGGEFLYNRALIEENRG